MSTCLSRNDARRIVDFLTKAVDSPAPLPDFRRLKADCTLQFDGRVWFVPDTFIPGERVAVFPGAQVDALHLVSTDEAPRSTWALPLRAHSLPRNAPPPNRPAHSDTPPSAHRQSPWHPCGCPRQYPRAATSATPPDNTRSRNADTGGEAHHGHRDATPAAPGCPFDVPPHN